MAKKLLTARERILLYLLNYASKDIDDYITPKGLTQDGIGEAIGVGRNNVPREMKRLLELKLVAQKKARVNGFRNRRSVYFLTSEGIREAKKLKEKLKNMYISVIDLAGNVTSIKMKDIPKKFGVDIISAALFVTKDKKLDLMDLLGINNRAVQVIEMDFKIRSFYGRKRELNMLKNWFKSQKKLLVVTGISGSGKTTLINKFVKEYLKNRNLIWFQIERWVNAADLIIKLGNFLSKIGKSKLERYIKVSFMGFEKELRWENAYQILKSDLRNEVLIFDGLENARDDVKDMIRRIIGMVDDTRELRIILIGKEIPQGIIPPNKMLFLEELILGDLDRDDALAFLLDGGKTMEEAEEIIEKYGAMPLVLELMAKNGNLRLVKRHFIENVIYSLAPNEIKALELSSIFRHSIKPNFLLLQGVDYPTIYSLINKNIFKEVKDDKLMVHSVIRNFVYQNMPSVKIKEYHYHAARYLEQEGEYLEAAYHYMMADRVAIASRVLMENYKKYILKGKIENVREIAMELLNRYDLSVSDHEWELYGILGDTYEISGDMDKALENYEKARDLSKHRDMDFFSAVVMEIADIHRKKGKYEKAKKELEESMKYIVNVRNKKVVARARYILGILSLYMGDTFGAEEHFSEALKLSESALDYEALGYAYQGLGILYRHTNSRNLAVEYFHRAKNYFEVCGNKREEAKSLGNIGLVYYDMRNEKEENIYLAESYFLQALKIFELIGDRWNIALTKRNLAAIYEIREEYEKALDALSLVEADFREMGGWDVLPSIYMQYGYVFASLNNPEKSKEYFDKAISLSIELGNEYRAIKYASLAAKMLKGFKNIDIEIYQKIAEGEKKVVAIVTKN